MGWYADPSDQLTFEDIRQPDRLSEFMPHRSNSFNLGYVDYPVWFHVSLHRLQSPPSPNPEPQPFENAPWQVLIDYAPLDQIDIYQLHPNGEVEHLQLGDSQPFDQRLYDNHNFVFPVLIAEGETIELFIRVKTSSSLQMPLTVHSPKASLALNTGQNTLYGVYFGIMTIMLFYNLFIFFILKDRSYVYYILHVASFALLQAAISGHAYQYLWPEAIYWQKISIPVLIFLNCFFVLFFTRRFLDLDKSSAVINRLAVVTALAALLCTALCFVIPFHLALFSSYAFTFVSVMIVLSAGFKSLANGYHMARIFLLAWSAQLIGASVHALTAANLLPQHYISLHAGLFGSSIEVVLLSLALADRFKQRIRESESVAKDTSQKLFQVNQQLNQALQEQKRLVQVKDHFLATISHELRTPMNGVEGSLTLIDTDAWPREQKAFISAAQQSAREMTGKIDAILRFSEIESGELTIKRERMEIRELLNPLIVEARSRCLRKGLTLGFSVDRDVPPIIEADREQILHIVSQLLDNAIKFTHKGQVQVCVGIERTENTQGDRLSITIQDTGEGMPSGQVTTIFNAFKDSQEEIDRHRSGLGIGLTICKQLTELMGGELALESTEGVGSSFTVKLPLILPSDLPQLCQAEPEPTTLHQKTVLIAEDNPVNQMVLRGMLEHMGCMTLTASNGQEVCDLMASQPIDLILMDCQMPLMDGFETTRFIRNTESAYNSVPIIAVTANALSTDSRRCMEAGMNDYLKKPIDRLQMEDKVKHWLKCGKMAVL